MSLKVNGDSSRCAPYGDQVFLWPHVNRIPTMVLRIPQVKIIVMHGARAEVLGTGLFE
jgi:hypothetical protein